MLGADRCPHPKICLLTRAPPVYKHPARAFLAIWIIRTPTSAFSHHPSHELAFDRGACGPASYIAPLIARPTFLGGPHPPSPPTHPPTHTKRPLRPPFPVPKNKSKSGGAGGGAARAQGVLREKADGESYALVTKVLGGGNVEAACLDGLSRRIVIRGTIRRRAWIRANDILIIEMRHGMSDETKVVRVQGSAPCAPRARGGPAGSSSDAPPSTLLRAALPPTHTFHRRTCPSSPSAARRRPRCAARAPFLLAGAPERRRTTAWCLVRRRRLWT